MASNTHKLKRKNQNQNNLSLSESQIEELKPKIVEAVIAQINVSETFSGPYPHPKHLEVYEKHYPGFLEKSITLTEIEQSNYSKSIARRDWQDFGISILSLLVVILFICSTLGGGFYLLLKDKEIGGYVLMLGSIASVISAIWNNRAKKEKSNQDKPVKNST